jgi:PTS system mannose-specific IIC component
MVSEIFAASVISGLIGGLLCVDRTAAFQVMLSRPLVSATVIGLCLGSPSVGLSAGVLLELLYMADRPVGSYMPAHETGLAVVVTAVSIAFFKGLSIEMLVLDSSLGVIVTVLLVSIPVAMLFRSADSFTRRMNERLFINAERALKEGDTGKHGVVKENLKGLFNFFWPTSVFIFAAVFILSLVAGLIAPYVSAAHLSVLYPVVIGALVLAVSVALNAVRVRGSFVVFSASAIAMAFIWTFFK